LKLTNKITTPPDTSNVARTKNALARGDD